MAALYYMIPVAVIVVGLAIWLFFWAVNSGQYDDLDSPAHSILFDDDDPKHKAGVEKADQEAGRDQDKPSEIGRASCRERVEASRGGDTVKERQQKDAEVRD